MKNSSIYNICVWSAVLNLLLAAYPDQGHAAARPKQNLPDLDSIVLGEDKPEKKEGFLPGLKKLAGMLESREAQAASEQLPPLPVKPDDIISSPQNLRSPINPGGPETWPESRGITTGETADKPAAAPAPGMRPAEEKKPEPAPAAPEFGVLKPLPANADIPVIRQSAPGEIPDAPPTPPARTEQTQERKTPASAAPLPAVVKPAAPAPTETRDKKSASQPAQTSGSADIRGPVPVKPDISSNATRPVRYVNEQGQEVPKPLEPDKMIAEAERLMDGGQNHEALEILKQVKDLNLEKEVREHVLYLISDAVQAIYATKPLEGYEAMVSAASEAMNANLMSSRVPEALFRIGVANLKVDNLIEAEAYFKALLRRFPANPEVPTAYYMLGKALLEKGRGKEAVEYLQYILQNYPESKVLREASIALALALHQSGDYKQTGIILDFVAKRWPRYYIDDPNLLLVEADLKLRRNELEEGLQTYWLYYNLKPSRPGNDLVMLKLGDLYLQMKRQAAADEMFEEITKRHPDSPTALTASMRLAERGIHEGKFSIEEMFDAFKLKGSPQPYTVYKKMIGSDPNGKYGIEAALKLCMWDLWKQENIDALAHAAEFIDNFPEHPGVVQAREIIWRAFSADLKNSMAEENYGRILILWNGFPLIRERYGPIDDNMRTVLAKGYLERGDRDKAFELLSEFITPTKKGAYSDFAFTLFFNDLLQKKDWDGVLNLGEVTKNWQLEPSARNQMDYAMALAAENLNLPGRALPIWQRLLPQENIPTYERAYAAYFLAKDAEQRKDIKDSYKYNLQALNFFTRLADERSENASPERVKETITSLLDITEVANRIPESLEWLDKYKDLIPEDSPEIPGILFREARLYRKLGDAVKAKALLEIVARKAPNSPFAKAAEVELSTFNVSRDLNALIPPK